MTTLLHEMDLDDFWRHPVGWDVVMARFEARSRLITTVACYYILYGSWLLLAPWFESKALAF